MPDLCPKHEPRVARCIANTPHLDDNDIARLRADYARQCTPGKFACPPLAPIETVREYR